jgi:hypothetical protein
MYVWDESELFSPHVVEYNSQKNHFDRICSSGNNSKTNASLQVSLVLLNNKPVIGLKSASQFLNSNGLNAVHDSETP